MLSNLLADVNQFLPTPSHGGRHPLLLPRAPRGIISTHALTWRATSAGEPPNDRPPDFYPRPHMEGDLCTLIYTPPTSQFLPTPSHGGRLRGAGGHVYHVPPFLPTPSHGGRPFCASNSLWISYFYPRPHMEGDAGGRSAGGFRADISTHALTWRATNCSSSCLPVSLYFYPRPHMEGDRRQHKGREKE